MRAHLAKSAHECGDYVAAGLVGVRTQTVTAVLRAGCYAAGRYSPPALAEGRRRAAHTSRPMGTGRRARTRPPCCRRESAKACRFAPPLCSCPGRLPLRRLVARLVRRCLAARRGLRRLVRIDPFGHRGRAGHGLVGNGDVPLPRDRLGIRDLGRNRWPGPAAPLRSALPVVRSGACSSRNARQTATDLV